MEQGRDLQDNPTPLLWLLLVAVGGAVVSASAWWLARNELPNGFQNEYEHLYTLGEVFFRLRDNGWQDAQGALWGGYYPPLNHFIGSAAMALFGASPLTAGLSQSVFLLLLLGATAWLGKRIGGGWVGAMALLALASSPAVFGNIRRYEPNSSLAAAVAVAVALLVWGRGLRSRRFALLYGAVCGLGMLCDRAVFAVYLLPAFVGVVAAQLRSGTEEVPNTKEVLVRLGSVVLGAGLVSGYYYFHFFQGHIDEILSQLGGEVTAAGEMSQSFPPWTALGLFYYPLSWLDCQMGLLPGLFVLLGLLLYGILGVWRRVDRSVALPLELWLFVGLMLITLVGKKQPFYSIPLLAPAAVLAAMGWRQALREDLRWIAMVLLVTAGLHQGLFLTTHQGLVPAPGRWAHLAGESPFPPGFLGYEYTQAAAPLEQGLDLGRVAALCKYEQQVSRKPYVLVFSEADSSPENQVMPSLRLWLDTLLVEGIRMQPEAVEENLHRAACFLHLSKSPQTWPSSASIGRAARDFGGSTPSPAFLEGIARLEKRARRIARWQTKQREFVQVYALAEAAGEAQR